MEEKMKQAYWVGIVVLIMLGTMTIGEYFIGSLAGAWWAPLLAVACLKAYFILKHYMHIGKVFASTESESEVQ
jgi:hypothetical protein